MISPADISDRIIAAILAQRLQPGARLVETQLAALFAVSRTQVRESLHRFATKSRRHSTPNSSARSCAWSRCWPTRA
ncbi:MAG: GntR family transcriptional regulator [Thiomonas sp.]|uniref:Putative GntR-family transcriptional regulator n=1 Tax=mine drainage metagenome TaxID=410659 RepID=E6PMQ0_9ZZZZ